MKKFAMLVLVAMASLVLTACGGGGGGGGETIDLVMGEGGAMAYSPASIPVKAGTKYTVKLTNKDAAQAHSVIIPSLNVNSGQIAAGKTGQVSFTAPASGTVEFHCDVPGHKEANMVGKFNVQ